MNNGMVFPELYAKTSGCVITVASYLTNKYKYLIDWKDSPSIQEFGYGNGATSNAVLRPHFPSNYKEFVATDVSRKMLEYAEGAVDMPRAQFTALDISTRSIPEDFRNRFDNIFSYFTNHLVTNPRQMFKNVYTMLDMSGHTFQVLFEESPIDIVFKKMSEHPKWRKYPHKNVISQHFFESEKKKKWEEDIMFGGFKNYSLFREEVDYDWRRDEWKDFYCSVNPILSIIPNEQIEEYKEEFCETIRRHVLTSSVNYKNENIHTVKMLLYVFSGFK